MASKLALFVTVVTSGPAQVFIFPTRWLVTATIILRRSLGCVDSSGQSGALWPRAAEAAIVIILIAPTFLVVPARSFGLGELRAVMKQSLCLLRAEWKGISVLSVIVGRFLGGVVAPGAASIHPTDLQRKVQGGFGLSRNSLLDGLVQGVFVTTFLLGLGTDGGPLVWSSILRWCCCQ